MVFAKRPYQNKNTHLDCTFTAFLFKVAELHHLSHDEAFLKVGVDLSSSLRSFGPFLLVRNNKTYIKRTFTLFIYFLMTINSERHSL